MTYSPWTHCQRKYNIYKMKRKFTKIVARVVAKSRKKAGMSQEELANRSDLDRTYISGIERGIRNITLNSLEKVVNGLEMDMEVFLQEIINEFEI